MAREASPFYLRLVNCLPDPERSLVEVFRVLVFGVLVNPCPRAVYDTLWSTASWGEDVRRETFEAAFQIVIVSIDEVEFAVTLIPSWFVAYNEAVEDGDVSITASCPCDSF
jgi:hypothetical protein